MCCVLRYVLLFLNVGQHSKAFLQVSTYFLGVYCDHLRHLCCSQHQLTDTWSSSSDTGLDGKIMMVTLTQCLFKERHYMGQGKYKG